MFIGGEYPRQCPNEVSHGPRRRRDAGRPAQACGTPIAPLINMKYLATVIFAASGLLWAPGLQEPTPEVVRAFQRNVAEYVSLRDRLERSLPPLDANSSAQQLHSHREALLRLLSQARAGAKKGDVFGVAMSDYTRARVRTVLEGPDGPPIRHAVTDVNPSTAVVEINRHYPSAIPLSRMPAALLETLPPLPEGLEYHFVGNALMILDTNARMVVDVMDNILMDTSAS
jgi:hypothetical protein